jgi:hypothetical protein
MIPNYQSIWHDCEFRRRPRGGETVLVRSEMSHFEIRGDKRISRHLSNFPPELDKGNFRVADNTAREVGSSTVASVDQSKR